MIDRELVIRKVTLILRDVGALKPIADRDLADYLGDPYAEILAERYLERIIGRMIDLNYHLLTEQGQAPPADYYASFVQLGPLGVLEPEFARQVAACAGLRNRIVHEYDEIDPSRVHEALPAALRDIPEYLRRVEAYVERAAG